MREVWQNGDHVAAGCCEGLFRFKGAEGTDIINATCQKRRRKQREKKKQDQMKEDILANVC